MFHMDNGNTTTLLDSSDCHARREKARVLSSDARGGGEQSEADTRTFILYSPTGIEITN